MRRILTGVDDRGRSTVIAVEELDLRPSPGEVALAPLSGTHGQPPEPPIDRPAHPPLLEMDLAPGSTQWLLVAMGPGYHHPDHRTDTVDYDCVLAGEAELLLDDGSVTLRPGDCAVLPGVAHQWRAGPQGCTLSITMVGLEPLPDDGR